MEYYSATERNAHWEFPGGPVVRTPILLPGVLGSIPNQGIKVLQAVWESQKKKKRNEAFTPATTWVKLRNTVLFLNTI